MTFWGRYFLVIEAMLVVMLTLGLGLWLFLWDGQLWMECFMDGQRMNLYRTTASISGTLLGFSIAVSSFALTAFSSNRLTIVKRSPHYKTIWTTFFQAVWFLGALTITSFVCLLFDRENAPTTWLVIPFFLFFGLVTIRLIRAIWILQKTVGIIAQSDNQ